MKLTSETKEKIEEIFEEFINSLAEVIKKISFNDLHFNPFLNRLMSKSTEIIKSREIITRVATQTIERKMVTRLGNTLRKIVKIFSEEKLKNVDIVKIKNGKRYHIMVTGGPTTLNSSGISDKIRKLKLSLIRYPEAEGIVGICYGQVSKTRKTLKSEIENTTGFKLMVEKEFWNFISDVPSCFEDIYKTAEKVSNNFFNSTGKSLQDLSEHKVKELTEKFVSQHGESMKRKTVIGL